MCKPDSAIRNSSISAGVKIGAYRKISVYARTKFRSISQYFFKYRGWKIIETILVC